MKEKFQGFSHNNFPTQNSWKSINTLHHELLAAKNLVYTPCGFTCSQPLMEAENTEYGAYVFELNGLSVRFRVAKVTPTKIGQFVTLWKRIEDGPIQPYDIGDPFDFFVVSARNGDHFGQFVFPKAVLCEQGVISKSGEGGKRAMRVYPPWDKTINQQAQKTQGWQVGYFLEIPLNKPVDCARSQMLYSPTL